MPKENLSRYFDILNNKLPAQFLISKSLKVDFDKNASVKELWEIHDNKIREFDKDIIFIKEFAKPSLLDLKIAISEKLISECILCERRCGINREKKIGYCGIKKSRYYSEFIHFGEERELVPSHTIFFSGCNFSCVYCQNSDISNSPLTGIEIIPEELADIITFRSSDSKNVNFVTPTPHTHIILKTLNSLNINIPVIWNSNMYYSKEVSKLLEGVIDVYLGDFKYGSDICAKKYSDIPNYWEIVTRNFKKAYNKGEILLRHLVIPNHIDCCTKKIILWVKQNIPDIKFNLMFQYRPCYKAYKYLEINRNITIQEYTKAIEILEDSGLEDILTSP